jgi:Carboxypeptidase regulatory-like domain
MKTIFLFVLAELVGSLSAQSQLGTGAVSGVVVDGSGKSIAGAAVRVTGEDTGLTRQTTSSGSGDFSIPVLPTGHYTLTVEEAGFSKLEQKNLNVTVGATVTLSPRSCHAPTRAGNSFTISPTKALASPNSIRVLSM